MTPATLIADIEERFYRAAVNPDAADEMNEQERALWEAVKVIAGWEKERTMGLPPITARDEIKALRADNARLREALERIRAGHFPGTGAPTERLSRTMMTEAARALIDAAEAGE